MYTMNQMISALSVNFPRTIGELDNAHCSQTHGQLLQSTFAEATARGEAHSQGPIRVVAAWNIDPDADFVARAYVGLDEDDGIWLFSIAHMKHWNDDALKGHPNHGAFGLVYEMGYCWQPIDGPMGDDFWDDMDAIVGALIGKKSTRTSVENHGFYPSMEY